MCDSRFGLIHDSVRLGLRAMLLLSLFTLSLAAFASDYIEPEMVLVPKGRFLYGPTVKEISRYTISPNERPAVPIDLSAYRVGKYEITNEEYALFITDGGYDQQHCWSKEGWASKEQNVWFEPRQWSNRYYQSPGKERFPVCAISWYEAEAYCKWLSLKTGKPYRLPTEHEWEKTARGTNGRTFPWGNEWQPLWCNWSGPFNLDVNEPLGGDPYFYPYRVGSFPSGASAYGCYDMAGNVMEWCQDVFSNSRLPNITGRERVYRGGSFRSRYPRWLRSAWRGGSRPDYGYVYWGVVGFRVALDVDPKAQASANQPN